MCPNHLREFSSQQRHFSFYGDVVYRARKFRYDPALFTLNVGIRVVGCRLLMIIGGLVLCGSYMLNALVPGIAALFIAHGVLYGIGVASTSVLIFIEINNYFERRLGFAFMVASVGGCAGSFVFPIIIQKLIDTYGLQGALLVISSILLNNVVIGALYRPFISRVRTKTDVPKNTKNNNTCYSSRNGELTQDDNTKRFSRKVAENPIAEYSLSVDDVANYYEPEVASDGFNDYKSYVKLIATRKRKPRSYSESCETTCVGVDSTKLQKTVFPKIDIFGGLGTASSFCSVYSLNVLRQQEIKPDIKPDSKSDSASESGSCSCYDIIDFRILKNRHLLLLLFMCLVSVAGCGLIVIYIPPFAKDHDIPNDKIAILVTLMGVFDLVSRFALAWISDSKRIRRDYILGCCLGITGLAVMFNPLYTNFESFVVFSIIYGSFGNVYFSYAPLLLRDCVGSDRYPTAFSLMIQVHGIAFVGFTPLLGLARDLTGSYTLTFYIMGAGILLGSVAVFCEPIFQWLENKRNKV
ncbi:monocarboxylate transporter 12-like [Mytilus californianus]|uniref:monocarboxylate transporter 12-like n=1 Tax=Mytilus californianus TaxID=6549 RepID=UPI002245BAEE|nr:monocarboxylate transporter 12-like [Mytilus californianus]